MDNTEPILDLNQSDDLSPDVLPVGRLGLITSTTKEGHVVVIPSLENVIRAVLSMPTLKGKFRYNFFIGADEVFDSENNQWRRIVDEDYVVIGRILANAYPHQKAFLNAPQAWIVSAVTYACSRNQVSPPADYIKSLEWDGTPRINKWITNIFNAEDNLLNEYIGRHWLSSLVKRIVMPACKVDTVLVVEGKQGIGKSTVLEYMGKVGDTDGYKSMLALPQTKEFMEKLIGATVVEFSEGAVLKKADLNTIKQQVTATFDSFRPAYARKSSVYYRTCVFAMTTNEKTYLKDETGARRWLIVEAKGQANIEYLYANYDQLLAEAYQIVKDGEETWRPLVINNDLELLREAKRERRVEEDKIEKWYYAQRKEYLEEGFLIMDIWESVFRDDIHNRELSQQQNVIIGRLLSGLYGFEKRRVRKNEKQNTYWFPTTDTYTKLGEPEGRNIVPKMEIEGDIFDIS